MLYKYSEVLNLPVICADNGSKAGTVKDVLLDGGDRQVKALVLEQKGLAARRRVVPLDDRVNLGNGAVIVGSSDCVAEMDRSLFKDTFGGKTAQAGEEGGLIGTKVYSKTGDEVGVIMDVIFDPRTGRIEGFEISDGLLQDVMHGRKLLPLLGKVEFGREFAVVDKEAVDEMKETGGGIKNMLLGGQ
ncbi:MAG TPA: PRC-barrel domain-containing protein [Clostridia bacterium]